MKSQINCYLLFISALLLFACGNNNQNPNTIVDLKLDLKTGNKYLYENTIMQELYVLNISFEQEMTTVMQWEILQPEADNVIIEMFFQKIKIKSKAPDKTIIYNSESSASNKNYLSGISSLQNKKIRVYISPKGKVQSIAGLDELLKEIQNQKDLKNFFTDSTIYYTIQSTFYGLPDRVVKVNDTWNNHYTLPVSNFAITFQNKYLLKKIDKNKAEINITSNLFTDKNNNANQSADMSGTLTGTKTYNAISGLVVKSNTQQELSGTFVQNGTDVPFNLKQSESTTCKLITP